MSDHEQGMDVDHALELHGPALPMEHEKFIARNNFFVHTALFGIIFRLSTCPNLLFMHLHTLLLLAYNMPTHTKLGLLSREATPRFEGLQDNPAILKGNEGHWDLVTVDGEPASVEPRTIEQWPRHKSAAATPISTPRRFPVAAGTPNNQRHLLGPVGTPPNPRQSGSGLGSPSTSSPTFSDGRPDRDGRASNRGEGIPSPVQNKAPLAPARCWEVHQQCCLTGESGYGDDEMDHKDIVMAHIHQHARTDEWRKNNYEALCRDPGPNDMTDMTRHNYLGYHKICSLNNMAPMTCTGHELYDKFVIGIDHRTGQVIPFVSGRARWAQHQYNVSHVPQDLQPHTVFLDAQLQQCVAKYCLPPSEVYACFEDLDYDDDGSNDDGAGWDSEGDERLRNIRKSGRILQCHTI
ncbi:hypothetical protein GGX14DRAFT_602079, partial [Mycena pura]